MMMISRRSLPGGKGITQMAVQSKEKRLAQIYAMPFASVYPHYVTKAKKKGRTQEEVDKIIRWLTGFTPKGLQAALDKQISFETFFTEAPELNPGRALITGVVCGVRVEEVEEDLMREIRYLDMLIDELARGRAMEKILRRF